jgi:5-methylcytosine-specific restriction protein A
LTTKTRCDLHLAKKKEQIKIYDKKRGTPASRGYDSKWTEYSRLYRKNNPLCVVCLAKGILTSVERGGHVDHIKPVTGPIDPLFWEPSNHQSLCSYHHRVKTASEDGAFGNRKKQR